MTPGGVARQGFRAGRGVRIWCLRHAMPQVDPARDPATWSLSAAGRAAAAGLACRLPARAVLLSSDEPKALETLLAARPGSQVWTDARLREVARPGEPFDAAEARSRRAAWLAGHLDDRHAGWEPFDQVGARMAAGIRAGVLASQVDCSDLPGALGSASRDVVVAGHGMALTAWAVHAGAVPREAAVEWWASLEFPDLRVIEG